MDIDLEDQLRSEIDNLRYEVEDLWDIVDEMTKALLKFVTQPVQFKAPEKYTWADSTGGTEINSNAQHQQAEAAKNQRLSHLIDVMTYAHTPIDKDEWAKQWQYALDN